MKLEKILEDQLIYDGMDDHFYEPKSIIVSKDEVVTFQPFPGKMLGEYDQSEINKLLSYMPSIKFCEVMKGSFVFKNKRNLTTFIKEQGFFIIVYSAEEISPGRYKMQLDYLFKVIN